MSRPLSVAPQTLRYRWLNRAGPLTQPAGQLTLTISGDEHTDEIFTGMVVRDGRIR